MKLIRKIATFPLSNNVLLWFVSYLTSRVQYVTIGTDKSPTFIAHSGSGQGSIKGDLDMDGIFCFNFADDKKIASIIKSEEDAIKLQNAIDQFFKWCCDNGLEIYRTKSKIITYLWVEKKSNGPIVLLI